MLTEAHKRALHAITARLRDTDVSWAVTGTTGFALHGLPVRPHDIDIQTDERGAYEIERLLAAEVARRVCFSSADRIRSHFGSLKVQGIQVEIMGAVQKSLGDGQWEEPVDVGRYTEIIDLDGMDIPVLSIGYEIDAYEGLGRMDRAEELRAWLRQSQSQPGPEL